MLKIPYIKQPDSKSCALACYAMVAKHFFPEINLDEITKISNWQPAYVVWSFKFWVWIMDKGIKITEYDTIDSEAWANEGIEGLRKSISEKEFEFYVRNTKDLDSYSDDIKKVLAHPNFIYIREKPAFNNLEEAIKAGKMCEVVLDSRNLRNKDGFSLHRVVVLDIDNNQVIFHDPAIGPDCKAKKEKFKTAWLDAVSEPELCIYQA